MRRWPGRAAEWRRWPATTKRLMPLEESRAQYNACDFERRRAETSQLDRRTRMSKRPVEFASFGIDWAGM